MATHTLEFERPLLELERQIEELKRVAGETAVDVSKEIVPLERKLAELRQEIYRSLTPMQRVQVARHPKRPYTLDYLRTVFTDFLELHGDRLYRDDPAIVGGWARLDGASVMVRRTTRIFFEARVKRARRSVSAMTIFISASANAMPRQRRIPPPKGKYAYGSGFLSPSQRSGEKLCGSG